MVVAEEPLSDGTVATLISAGFGIVSWFLGDKWRVDEREALGPARPLHRMIDRATKVVPGLSKVVKAVSDPAVFSEEIGSIVQRRTRDEQESPAVASRPQPATPMPIAHTNGVSRDPIPPPDGSIEERRLKRVERFSGIVNE